LSPQVARDSRLRHGRFRALSVDNVREGTHSAWLYEILSPHVEEIVVAGIREGRGQRGPRRKGADAGHERGDRLLHRAQARGSPEAGGGGRRRTPLANAMKVWPARPGRRTFPGIMMKAVRPAGRTEPDGAESSKARCASSGGLPIYRSLPLL
jgi:hypothetical protein